MSNISCVLNDAIKARVATIDTDHPLSLGWKVVVISNSKLAGPRIAISDEELDEYLGDSRNCCGMHAVYDSFRTTVITVKGKDEHLLRVIELVVHEVSHAVDAMFERAHVELVDTELRAYYNDWMVGKIMAEFVFPGNHS